MEPIAFKSVVACTPRNLPLIDPSTRANRIGPKTSVKERISWQRLQQRPGLAVAQGRRLALVILCFGALDPADRVVADRVDLAEVVKERGHGGELAADGAGGPGRAVRGPCAKQ